MISNSAAHERLETAALFAVCADSVRHLFWVPSQEIRIDFGRCSIRMFEYRF